MNKKFVYQVGNNKKVTVLRFYHFCDQEANSDRNLSTVILNYIFKFDLSIVTF